MFYPSIAEDSPPVSPQASPPESQTSPRVPRKSPSGETLTIEMRLIDACKGSKYADKALKIIKENPNMDFGAVNNKGETALLCACIYAIPEVALALIATGKSNPSHILPSQNTTALQYTCSTDYTMPEVALALIATGKSRPDHIDNDSMTALLSALSNEDDEDMTEVAMALIATGKSRPDHIDNEGNTALIFACSFGMSEVVFALIATGKSRPDHINNDQKTALISACYEESEDIALALIATGKSRPDHINNEGNTALIFACSFGMTAVTLALIATGKSRPDQVDNEGNTALIYACANNSSFEIIQALIATGQSRPEYENPSSNESALSILCDRYETIMKNKHAANAAENNLVLKTIIVPGIKLLCATLGPSSPLYDDPAIRKVLLDINDIVQKSNQNAETMTKLYAMPYASNVMSQRSRDNKPAPIIPQTQKAQYAVTSDPYLSRHIFSYLKHPTIKTGKPVVTEISQVNDPFSGGRKRRRRTYKRRHKSRKSSRRRSSSRRR